MFVRRGRGAASARFATGAAGLEADGAGANGVACAVVAGVDDGFAGAGAGVGAGAGAGFGGSDLATAFSSVLGGAAFTGVGAGADFDGVLVAVSAFGDGLALGGVAGDGAGCDATVCGAVVLGVTGFV